LFDFTNSVGLQKILQLLTSEDSSIQIHAVKVVANLAAEGALHSAYNFLYRWYDADQFFFKES
jgi:hypothetical protein